MHSAAALSYPRGVATGLAEPVLLIPSLSNDIRVISFLRVAVLLIEFRDEGLDVRCWVMN